jgi:uncharacterized protein YlxW (UPF0749 family)
MKLNETSIFVFIASIIIGLLISLNISFKESSARVVLSADQYQEALNSRSKLYKEIGRLKEEYYENEEKLLKYKSGSTSISKILQELTEEMNKNNLVLGNKDIVGEGLKFTINDASMEFENFIEDQFTKWLKIVHNTDIMVIINELRNAGAEAISINGQRVISSSEVYCSGPFLRVNGVQLSAPFYINVIGNKEVIKNYMMNENGYLKTLMYRGIQVQVQISEDVKIPAYVGNINYKYMTEAVKK